MSQISMDLVKELRNRTQLGLNSCRAALIKCDGDMESAIDFLKKAGKKGWTEPFNANAPSSNRDAILFPKLSKFSKIWFNLLQIIICLMLAPNVIGLKMCGPYPLLSEYFKQPSPSYDPS